MRTIGSRELKASLGQVLREVNENQESFVITIHGRPVARLVPDAIARESDGDFDTLWSVADDLAREIAKKWPVGLSAAEAIRMDRRDL